MPLACQVGFELLLARELADAGASVAEQGPGWAPDQAKLQAVGRESPGASVLYRGRPAVD